MLNEQAIRKALSIIDSAMTRSMTLCVIGSAATILMGQKNRYTEDIDVWANSSLFHEDELRSAVESAGLSWNPRDVCPEVPYVQIVHPGIVKVPGWNPSTRTWFGQPEEVIWSGRCLSVTVPPPQCLIASKLIRGTKIDIEDCLWLLASKAIDANDIMSSIRKLPKRESEVAEENLYLLNLMKP